MKKIINWTFGSVFRTFGRIFAYLLVGGLFTLICLKNDIKITDLLGFDYVNAATISTSSDQWATQWCSDRTCDYTQAGSTYFRDYANVNSGAYTNSNSYYLTAIRLRQQFNSSNYLQTGTQYQLRYKLWFNPKYKLSYYDMKQEDIDFVVTDSGNNQVTLDNSMFTCSFSNIENQDSFFLTCFYTPTSNIKQVYIRIKMPFDRYVSYSSYTGYIFKSINTINYTSSSITYNTGTQDAIQNQTTIITNQTNEINNSINNLQENNNQNTQEIINNNNANTQSIIDSQTENQKVCSSMYGNYDSLTDIGYLSVTGQVINDDTWRHSDYIPVSVYTTINHTGSVQCSCFYDEDRNLLSCVKLSEIPLGDYTLPNGTIYVRYSINYRNQPQFIIKSCKNGNQALNDFMNDDNVNDSEIEEILDDMPQLDESSYGPLTSFLTMPLTWIQSLLASGQTCTTLHLPLPYLNNVTLDLPCMTDFWNNLGALKVLIELVWIAIVGTRIFNLFFKLTIEAKSTDPNSYEKLTKLKEWEL